MLWATSSTAVPTGTVISNQAHVTYVASAVNLSADSNVDTVTVQGQLNVANLTIASDHPISHPGDTVTWSTTLSNGGSNVLSGGQLSFNVPPGTTVTPPTGVTIQLNNNIVTANLADIAPSATATLPFSLVLPMSTAVGPSNINLKYDANSTTVTSDQYVLNVQARTQAHVAFMLIDGNSGSSTPIPITQYQDGSGNFINIPAPPVANGGTQLVTDVPQPLAVSTVYHKNETMFVLVNDSDKNIDPNKVDSVTVSFDVTDASGSKFDFEIIKLNETGPNTGQFVGYIVEHTGAATAHDGWLGITTNSRVDATYMDSSDASDDILITVLIDPYGIVFNSKTGQPIDGATVSFVNRDTGLPATVYGDDGVSSYPSTMVSGSSVSDSSGQVYNMPAGGFRFPLSPPGNYQLLISLPAGAGYAWPSQVPTASLQALSGGPFAIDVGSRGEAFVLKAGPALHLDIPLDPIGTGLFITKTANKEQVAVGDFLQYSLEIKNASTLTPVNAVVLTDVLPHGFKYQKGSLSLNDTAATDPSIADDGRTMSISVGNLAASDSATLRYVVQVATGREGEVENTAKATGSFGEPSNTARARVKVMEDFMQSHSLIMGRVSGPSPEGKIVGIPGVRIYLENGAYVVTDERGLYHFEGVRPGTHVVQLDVSTLPQKYDLAPPENDRFAGRSWSQFVDIQGGTMWRADFKAVLKEKTTGTAAVALENLLDLNQKTIYYKAKLSSMNVPLRNVRLTLLLPKGAHYVSGSGSLGEAHSPEPTVLDNMITFRLGDQAPNWDVLLQFSASLDDTAVTEDSITKALLMIDTPEQKNAKTQPIEVALLSHNVETGHEHKHYVMRWQFDSMEAELNAEAKQELDKLVQQLTGLSNLSIKVTGYSDSLPIRARSRHIFKDNLALSQARADSTAQYLGKTLAVDSQTLVVTGLGERNPLASNKTPEGRALNRRVEIEIDADQIVTKNLLIDGQRQSAAKEIKIIGLLPGEEWKKDPTAAEKAEKQAPQYDDQWLEATSPGIEWVMPAPDFLPSAPFVHIGIKHFPKQKVEVLIDGTLVDKVHFESTHVNAAQTVAYSWWRGVGLKDGDNPIDVIVTDKDGKEVSHLMRVIHYSRPPIKAELVKDQSVLTADGLTQPVIAVRLTDRDDYPAREGNTGEFSVLPPYVADTHLPEGYTLLAGAPGDKPRFVVGKNGIALIKLQPTTQAGEVKLNLPLMNGDHEIKTTLKPAMRDWILVGFAEGTVGYNSLKGNTESITGSAGQDSIYKDGQVALYAKGRVKGDWLMTLAYDTNKKKNNDQIFQTIVPGTYYTVYGDNSTQRYDAASGDKLYIKVEKDTVYALFGDYDTGLQSTKLFTYNRSLTGLKSEYKDDRYEAVIFASESNQGFIKDEIRGQGISGPYQLSHKTIVINSDKVRIQARDRFHSEVIVSEKVLSQHVDYNIDYVTGTISFREPVLSVDSNLNPVFIVVDYESFDGQNFSMTYGGRGQVKLDDKTQIGVTHINEGRVGGSARLNGADATYQINEQTQARVEVAQSHTSDNVANYSGNGYLAEIDHRAVQSAIKAYVSQYDAGFGVGQINGSEQGTRKIGAEGVYHANTRTDVQGQAYHQDNMVTSATREVTEAETRYRAGSNTELHLGMRAVQDNLGNDQTLNSTLLTSGVNQKFMEKKLTLHADRDQALGEAESVDFPSRTRVGFDYLLTDQTQVFVEQEFTSGVDRDTQTTVMGLKTVPWSGSEAFTSVSQKQDGTTDNTAAGVGLRQRLPLNSRWSLDGSVEKSKTVQGSKVTPFNTNTPFSSGSDSTSDFTATSLGLTYNPGSWLWNIRTEYRDASTGNQWGVLTSAQTSVGSDLGLLAALSLTDANLSTGHLFNSKLSFGLAYRPPAGKWLVLDKLDYIQDQKEETTDPYNSRRWVNNLNANYKATDRWQTSLQYGSKFVSDTLSGRNYDAYLDLMGAETRYDLNKNWDVGVHGSVLHAWTARQYDYSYGTSLGYTFATNMWVSVGYNLQGFYDKDFSQSRFTSKGPYLQLRLKFDQDSMKDILRSLNR